MAVSTCINCGSLDTTTLLELPSVPVVCNDLHNSASSAETAACGRMKIEYCSSCAHFYNSDFDDSIISYSSNYETSLYSSQVFQEYSEQLVSRLVSEFGIENKHILEIGCGRGEFLNALCLKGNNRGVGFDTSYDEVSVTGPRSADVKIHKTYFDSNVELAPVDLLVSQQVLEHVLDPAAFLEGLLSHPSIAGGPTTLYLEVPNGLYTFENDGIWDLIYEHVSYFSPESLTRLVEGLGCEILESGVSYGGQYLYILAEIGAENVDEKDAQQPDYSFVDGFQERFQTKLLNWAETLENLNPAKTFVWGAGSKGITFCNILDPKARLGGLIDRHPNKVGKFAAANGARIFALDELQPADIENVIVMNELYAEEIRSDLHANGITANVLSV